MAIVRPEAIDAAPVHGPKRSGGWREAAFLPREEWRRSRQGKKVAGRRCGKSIEAQPSFGQIKPREVAWPRSRTARKTLGDRLRKPKRDTPARPPPSLPQASAGRYRSDLASLSGVLCSASVGAVPKNTSMVLHDARRARSVADSLVIPTLDVSAGQHQHHTARRLWRSCCLSTCYPLHPERGVARPPASGIEPVRGETAQPVRAKPKSPAPRATPNYSLPRPRLNQSF